MKRLWRKRRRRKARYESIPRRMLKAFGLKKLPVYGAIISEPRVVEELAARVRQILTEGFDVVIWVKRQNWEMFEYWRRKVERTLELLRDLNLRDCRLDNVFHAIYLYPRGDQPNKRKEKQRWLLKKRESVSRFRGSCLRS